MTITDYHAKYFAHELTKRCSSDSMEKLAGAVAGAQVDLEEFTPLTGKEVWSTRIAVLRYAEVTYNLHVAEKRIRWGNDNTNGVPAFKRFRTDINTGERDFIYATTQHLSADQLAQLSDKVGAEHTLLVLCSAFRIPKVGAER